jgi:predicted glycoside hydrolase/deacetylase ChbG (UPF0249 family)
MAASAAWPPDSQNMSTLRALIVHADDFGETEEITRGISAGIEARAITSTTVMANMPGTAFALREVKRLGDVVSFGLHLNLCEGNPLTHCPSLTRRDGAFLSKRRVALRAMAGLLSMRELDAEVQAQAGLLRDAGVRLSHIDGHKHLHQLPQVRDAVVRAARRFALQRVRRSLAGAPGWRAHASTAVRQAFAWRAGRLFAANRLRYPARVVDLAEIERAATVQRGAELLGTGSIIEVFCHPGTEQADLDKPGSCDRNAELRFLLSDRWAELMSLSGREAVTYWRV